MKDNYDFVLGEIIDLPGECLFEFLEMCSRQQETIFLLEEKKLPP